MRNSPTFLRACCVVASVFLGAELEAQEYVSDNKATNSKAVATKDPEFVQVAGIKSKAKRIVYLWDASASMNAEDKFRQSKILLYRSIGGLREPQSFLVISFKMIPKPIAIRAEKNPTFSSAKPVNRLLAQRKVRGVEASGGTKVIPAMQAAIRHKPDVIFLVTDGDDIPDNLQEKVKAEIAERAWQNGERQKKASDRWQPTIHVVQLTGRTVPKDWSKRNLKKFTEEFGGEYELVQVDEKEMP